MLKKIAVVAALVAGFSWVVLAPAHADDHVKTGVDTSVQADADVDVNAVLNAVPGAKVREYDLSKSSDMCALLSLILGLDVDASVDVDADVDAAADVSAGADIGR